MRGEGEAEEALQLTLYTIRVVIGKQADKCAHLILYSCGFTLALVIVISSHVSRLNPKIAVNIESKSP